MKRYLVISASAALVLACAACSSSGSKSAPSSNAAPSSSAASSSSSSGSPSAAGQQFISLTAATGTDLTAFATLPDTTPIAQVQAAAAKVATDEGAVAQGLKTDKWPAAVAPVIANMATAVLAEQPVYQQASTQPTVAAVKAVLQQNQSKIAARAAANSQVLAALGLPVPTPSAAPTAATSPTASTTA